MLDIVLTFLALILLFGYLGFKLVDKLMAVKIFMYLLSISHLIYLFFIVVEHEAGASIVQYMRTLFYFDLVVFVCIMLAYIIGYYLGVFNIGSDDDLEWVKWVK